MLNLVPWKKPRENHIDLFRNEMDSLFDRFWGEDLFPATETLFDTGWLPRVDVSEGKKDITVKAEVPGMDPKDIDISLEDRWLRIKGEKKKETEEKDENFHRLERSYGFFNRTIELPAEVDASEVDASYKKGILKIKLKKAKESETKKITVKTG